MDISPTSLLSVALGLGLAAATGFRVFLTGIATAGIGNPVVSAGETIGATVVSLLAIAVPVVCLLVLVAMLAWAIRRAVAWMTRRQRGA